MLKKLIKIAAGILIASLLMFAAACENEVLPTGNLISQGGSPGGGTLEGGGSGTFPAFDIDNLPDPKFWNDNGHMEDWPDLFLFANGRRVQSVAEWDQRKAEIAKILQFYQYGFYPDSDPARLTVTYTDPEGAGTTAQSFTVPITVRYGNVERTFNCGVRLPAEAITPAGVGKKYPVLIEISGGDVPTKWTYLANDTYKWAMISLPANAIMGENAGHTGIVTDLYGYDANKDMDACGVYMAHAWGVSRIMDVIERGGFGGKVDVNKVVTTGMSRWGHSSMLCGAFSKTQDSGTMVAVTDVGDGGNAPERFHSVIGANYRMTDVSQAPGKTWYLKAVEDTNPFVNGVSPWPSVKAVWTKDNMVRSTDYDPATGDPGDGDYDYSYNFWNAPGGDWNGLATHSEQRKEVPSWYANRFQQFRDLHEGMGLDRVISMPDRYPYGYLCTIPFDSYHLYALIAPRGFLNHAGFKSGRVNPEGNFAQFLAVDEVYKYLDAEYANGIRVYYIGHSQPDYEVHDMWEFGEAYWSNNPRTNMPAKFRDHPFDIRDPRSKIDYSKIKWARPGATETIADMVADVDDSWVWNNDVLPNPGFNKFNPGVYENF